MQKNFVFHKPNDLSLQELETSVYGMLEVLGHHMLRWGLNSVTETCFKITLITIVFKSLWAATSELLVDINRLWVERLSEKSPHSQFPNCDVWVIEHRAIPPPVNHSTCGSSISLSIFKDK